MTLSIIIPAFNEEKYIGDCLKSILKYAPQNLLEIIVVNNASHDRTAEIAKQFDRVRVVYEPIKGLPRARQRGFEEAKGDVMLSLDADTRVPKGWFEAMQEELKEPNVVCVSGPYNFYDIPPWQRICVAAYWNSCAKVTYASTGYMVVGGNFAVKRDALKKIGGFNTDISFYGEDTDIAKRLHTVGTVVYSPRCWINSSGRRLNAEGLVKVPFVYALNYIWIAAFHKPLTKTHTDIR